MVLTKETSLFNKDAIKDDIDGLQSDVNGAVATAVPVYYRSTSHTTPSISASTSIGTSATTDNAWEYVMPYPKKNCYFYTCEQYISVGGTKSYSDVRELNNDTYLSKWVSSSDATFIDGGSIYTGSITANQIQGNTLTIGKMSSDTQNTILNSNIHIGGENILRNTDNIAIVSGVSTWLQGGWYKSGTGEITTGIDLTDPPIANVTKAVRLKVTSANTNIGLAQAAVPFKVGEITESVWAKGTAGDSIILQPIWSDYSTKTESGSQTFTIADNKWHKYSYTKTVAYDHEAVGTGDGGANGGYIYFSSATANHTIDICGLKIELGNVATDWAPAPDDITVNKYITKIDDTGIWVTPSGLKPTDISSGAGATGTRINSGGMEIYKGGTSVAKYGDTARVGKESANNGNIITNATGIDLRVGTTTVGSLAQLTNYTDENGVHYNNVLRLDAKQFFALKSNSNTIMEANEDNVGFIRGHVSVSGDINTASSSNVGVSVVGSQGATDYGPILLSVNNWDNDGTVTRGIYDGQSGTWLIGINSNNDLKLLGNILDDFVIQQSIENGYRIWFSGRAECWTRVSKNVALNNSYGTLYFGNWTWDFPITFASAPAVVCSEFHWGTGGSWGTVAGVSTTQSTLRGFDTYSRASGSCVIAAYAVGTVASPD